MTTSRPKLSDFTRPSNEPKTPHTHVAPETGAASNTGLQNPQTDVDPRYVPPESSEEKTAKGRLQLYENMQSSMLPVEDYKDYLKQHEISEDKAACIVDDILTQNFYEEEFKLSKRSSVRFRTRTQKDIRRLSMTLQIERPLYENAMNELVARYNLAASLSMFNGKVFSFPKTGADDKAFEDSFDERLKVVESMPSPIFALLCTKLAKFDVMVQIVMREGCVENF